MEKKQLNLRQGSNKALSTDTRKSTDSYSNKTVQRNSRRRENSTTTACKNDPQRNNKPVSNKTFRPNVDKRAKPRGNYGPTSTADGPPSTSPGLALDDFTAVEYSSNESHDYDVELNSVYNPGSKKQNFNHLLNFHYSSQQGTSMPTHSVFGRQKYRCSNIKKSKYNKEQYLQANFQFVIKSSDEKHLLNALPDTLIDWAFIEQINIQTTDEPQCPICLFPPVAAKLTRCGHAYCWPCILHYLALSDKSWRKCPICYEAVHLGDLKSTTIVQQTIYNVGSMVSFQLMRRKKGSMFIEKNKVDNESIEQIIPHLTADDDQKPFSKFILADRNEIFSITEREKKELENGVDSNCPESVFIQQALDLLQERKDNLIKESSTTETKLIRNKSISESVVDPNDTVNVSIEGIHGAISKDSTKFYYFYQSVDGQNIFLHPLNVKMLQAMYGTLNDAPKIINGQIVQKEQHSMTEELRKKFRCLEYLPLSCQFEVVEIRLDTPYVSEMILDSFKDEILSRQKTRLRREKEEKKREKEIERINERQMGKLIASSANIDIKSDFQFPICGFDEPLGGLPSPGLSTPSTSATAPTSRSSYASFANILSSPKKELWPTLKAKSSVPTSNCNELSLVKKSNTLNSNEKSHERKSESELFGFDVEGLQHENEMSLGDVLVEAIQQKKKIELKSNSSTKSSSSSSSNKCGGHKKNKKSNKMVLFSTGINYNGN